jgi:hypothetical protein
VFFGRIKSALDKNGKGSKNQVVQDNGVAIANSPELKAETAAAEAAKLEEASKLLTEMKQASDAAIDASKLLTEMKQATEAAHEEEIANSVKLEDLVKEEKPADEKPQPQEGDAKKPGLINDLFREEEDSGNSTLATLITSLNDVSCQELLEEINKVKQLVRMDAESSGKPDIHGGA